MEKSLIAAITLDDKRAFGLLYAIYAPKLRSYASGNILNPQDAEDIVQEVFVSLWNARHSLKNRDSISSFLFTTLRNRIANFRRDSFHSSLYRDYVKKNNDTCYDNIPAEYHELCRNLTDAINRLSSTQRKVVTLSRLHGVSNNEIANHLGIKLQTVKNSLSTGLRNLRRDLMIMECAIN